MNEMKFQDQIVYIYFSLPRGGTNFHSYHQFMRMSFPQIAATNMYSQNLRPAFDRCIVASHLPLVPLLEVVLFTEEEIGPHGDQGTFPDRPL